MITKNTSLYILTFMLTFFGLFLVARFGLPILAHEKGIPNTIQLFYNAAIEYSRGENFYQLHANSSLNYVYAPIFPIVVNFISSFLPANKLTFLWSIASALSLISILAIILFSFIERGHRILNLTIITLISIFLSWRGIIEIFSYGEPDFLIFFILYTSFFLVKNDYRIFAGILSSLALAYKLPFMFVLPMIFYYGGHKTVLGFLTAFALWAILIPAYFFGFDGLIYAYEGWNRVISEAPQTMFLGPDNQSIWAMFSRLLPNYQNIGMILAIFLGIIIFTMSFFATIPSQATSLKRHRALETPLIPTFWLVTYTLLTHSGWRWAYGLWIVVYLYVIFEMEEFVFRKSRYERIIYSSLLAISLTILALSKKSAWTKALGLWVAPYIPELHSAYTIHGLIIFFLFYSMSKNKISFPQAREF